MMWVYQCLDFFATITDMICLYVISRLLLKEYRFSSVFCKYIPPIAIFIFTWVLTWFSEFAAFKIPTLFILTVIVLKICYKDAIYQSIVTVELWFAQDVICAEAIGFIIMKCLLGDNLQIMVDGQRISRWEVYITIMITRMIVLFFAYIILKNFKYKIRANDCVIVSAVFIISFTVMMFNSYNVMNLAKTPDLIMFVSASVLSVVFFAVFLYSKNKLYFQEQEQKDKMQIAQLQQQFAYYQEKLKDEEKVRSVYHDMKNHLLVLQKQINSPETAEMVEKLQSQVAMYEDYEHTGNDILDIILKEKSEMAREKHIALSVTADLNGVDFIEPLDVSTIFGNGLDNAIEASEKLPEEQRAILMKSGKMQNFFSVLIENNCLQESRTTKDRTTKNDDFLHGFGISNMRKVAEKYGGQLTTKCESGKFLLKILLPIPSRLEVQ